VGINDARIAVIGSYGSGMLSSTIILGMVLGQALA